MTAHLITEWSTDDPGVAELLTEIAKLPQYSAARHEAEAGLHMMQARFAWRRADEFRRFETQRQVRLERAAARKATP